MKRSIFKTCWGSNVEEGREETNHVRRWSQKGVCCASKSLLMGQGGPLIPVWLFLSPPLAVNTQRAARSAPDFTLTLRNSFARRSFHRARTAGGSRRPCREPRFHFGLGSSRGAAWLARRASEGAAGILLSSGQLQLQHPVGDGVFQPRGN